MTRENFQLVAIYFRAHVMKKKKNNVYNNISETLICTYDMDGNISKPTDRIDISIFYIFGFFIIKMPR